LILKFFIRTNNKVELFFEVELKQVMTNPIFVENAYENGDGYWFEGGLALMLSMVFLVWWIN
jgi:hypothetical protein